MSRPRAPTHDEQADALEATLAAEDRALLDGLADGLVRRRLATAALFVLAGAAPLGYVASQAMLVLRPFVAAVVDRPETWDRLAAILERRGAVELLVRRLDSRL